MDNARKEESQNRKPLQVSEMPVYQLFHQVALLVEQQTRNLGPDFRWLRNQVLRSSESVCANMTEGFYTQYSTEYLQALFRCRREAQETLTHLRYGHDVQQLSAEVFQQLEDKIQDGLRQLSALISSIERKIVERGKAKPSCATK